MICYKIYKICTNVEMCEMCRPDTHVLLTMQKPRMLQILGVKGELEGFVKLGS